MTFIDAITVLNLKGENPEWFKPGVIHDTCEAIRATRLTNDQRKVAKTFVQGIIAKNGLIAEEKADLSQLIKHLSRKRGKNATSV